MLTNRVVPVVRCAVAGVFAVLAIGLASVAAQAVRPVDINFAMISSYHYNPNDIYNPFPPKANNTIPANIRQLEGKRVRLTGNVMAVDYSSGQMTEFLLQANEDNCGFGATPRINEWIYVTMRNSRKVPVITGDLRLIEGTFHISEEVEKGRVIGLYSIVADVFK